MVIRIVLVALLLVVGACGDDDTTAVAGPGGGGGPTTSAAPTGPFADQLTALAEARQRWADADIDDYTYRYTQLCFCPRGGWVVTVADGEVTGQVPAPDSDALGTPPEPQTMEGLFDDVEEAIAAGPASVEVSFDGVTGALERYWVDVDEMVADEEQGIELQGVTPTGPGGGGGSPPDVDLATLTEHFGCGYGFNAGDPGQEVALRIVADQPLASGTVTLPDPAVRGVLLTGTDLYANWCDDVLEPGEPRPVVDQELPIVAGTLHVTSPGTGAAGCGGATASVAAEDLVVAASDGSTLALGSIEITNDAYGCFAG